MVRSILIDICPSAWDFRACPGASLDWILNASLPVQQVKEFWDETEHKKSRKHPKGVDNLLSREDVNSTPMKNTPHGTFISI